MTVVHLRPGALLVGFLQRVAVEVELRSNIEPVVPLHTQLIPENHGYGATLVSHFEVGLDRKGKQKNMTFHKKNGIC